MVQTRIFDDDDDIIEYMSTRRAITALTANGSKCSKLVLSRKNSAIPANHLFISKFIFFSHRILTQV